MKYIMFIFILLLVIYEKIWRIHICKKKIYNHINEIGGELISIEKLTLRDEFFNVNFSINEKIEHATVKFNFFYKERWL